jgi:cytosine/adenosine deaminase-related metal-dependent hydrolase
MLILKNGTIITYTKNGELENKKADILIEKNIIKKIEQNIDSNKYENAKVMDLNGKFIIPGFIQTHIHLCQVLFKSSADDMELLDWLSKRIWPFEAMHDKKSIDLSARMGLCELISGGTTTVVDMGTLRHTEVIAENLISSGIRAFFGKTMMDHHTCPDYLKETKKDSIKNSLDLFEAYHNKGDERVKYAFAPRFAISCTDDLMIETAEICRDKNLLFHTHASENKTEVEIVKKNSGYRNIEYFEKNNIAGENLLLAHCIWVDDKEIEIIKKKKIKVLHCPSANLKLASGIAPIPTYMKENIDVSIGADGAPCNNNLSMFKEMRLAALIQKPIHGPTVMNANEVFKLATVGGAKVVGLEDEIGTIEVGKKADMAILDLNKVNSSPYVDPVSAIVYSCDNINVESVIVDGKVLYENKIFKSIDNDGLIEKANKALGEMIQKL